MRSFRQQSIILLIFISLAGFAQAEPKGKCAFHLHCENGEKKFSIQFKSASGDCTEDDMVVSFLESGKPRPLQLKEDWHFYSNHISKLQPSICKGKAKAMISRLMR